LKYIAIEVKGSGTKEMVDGRVRRNWKVTVSPTSRSDFQKRIVASTGFVWAGQLFHQNAM
jgi:hypothetical protein